MITIPDELNALTDYDQWVLWKIINGKKIPFNPMTLEPASSVDKSTWGDSESVTTVAGLLNGEYDIGFVFTETDPFYFIDLDKCLQPDNTWSPVANAMLSMVPGAAVEVSQSGTGLHIIGSYDSITEHRCKNIPLGLELYHTERFVALTGNQITGDAALINQSGLSNVIDQYYSGTSAPSTHQWTDKPDENWSGLADDEKLIAKALASRSASSSFGTRASFKDLWTCNIEALNDAFSPDSADTGSYDESSADAALAQHLAFWTGNDCERIERLMRQSGLVRDKWNREAYIRGTVSRAASLQTTFHVTKRKEPPRVSVNAMGAVAEAPVITDGYQFLGLTQQIEYFKGCCYVQDIHRIFTPSGALLKVEQFNATYGGYSFQLEADTNGKITRKAWEAYTESQGIRYPKAETTCFRPQLSTGAIIEEEGRKLVNTYVPIDTPCIAGDVTPFLTHLSKVLPDDRDRSILMAYMAAIIQHKGVKFQWAPLLQGTEGNGKTLFSRCVAFAIGRRYTHYPQASDIDNKFNAWVEGNIFIAIEDIYVAAHKQEVIEALKPMITNTELEIQGKGVDQITKEVCCNIMMNCNGKDNIRKTQNDRRFCVFFSAQQSSDDLSRDGMTGNYFPDLYEWLKNGGYAHVAHYMATYDIPAELNPADKCHRAPVTTSTEEAITAGMGTVEQEILEAIDEGRQGFANGWISSMALERLLDDRRMSRMIPRNKRRGMLQDLGYDWHPGLHDGRTTTLIMVDGGKPRLFIKKGHIHSALTNGGAIIDAYSKAQMNAINEVSEAFNNG